MRAMIALFIVGFFFMFVSFTAGILGCWKTSPSNITASAILMLIACKYWRLTWEVMWRQTCFMLLVSRSVPRWRHGTLARGGALGEEQDHDQVRHRALHRHLGRGTHQNTAIYWKLVLHIFLQTNNSSNIVLLINIFCPSDQTCQWSISRNNCFRWEAHRKCI